MVAWWLILAPALVLVVIAGAILLRRRSTDGILLPRAVYYGAVVAAVVTTITAVIAVLTTLLAPSVQVSMPVKTWWPTLPPGIEIQNGPTAEVVGGGFERAEVVLGGLDIGTRIWIASGHLMQGGTFAVISIAVALLARRLLKRDPFRATVSRAMTITAIALGLGGIAWQVCFAVGGLLASREVLGVTGWQADTDLVDADLAQYWPTVAEGFSIEFWPILVALAIGALALVFRTGESLRMEAEDLRRDTAGLV